MTVEAFKIEIAQEKLDDLARRLENVNLPMILPTTIGGTEPMAISNGVPRLLAERV